MANKLKKANDKNDNIEVHQPDYSNPRSLISLKVDNEKVDGAEDRKEFGNLIVKHKDRIIKHVAKGSREVQIYEDQISITLDLHAI